VEYLGVDPATTPIPVLPAVHYTMGGIVADAGPRRPCAACIRRANARSVGIHGANRLGSNSLTELLVFGKVAGDRGGALREVGRRTATRRARAAGRAARPALRSSRAADGNERIATLRREMAQSMEDGCGIYRTAARCRPPATSWPS
jgi:fumarate reductase flavoprotein subunit